MERRASMCVERECYAHEGGRSTRSSLAFGSAEFQPAFLFRWRTRGRLDVGAPGAENHQNNPTWSGLTDTPPTSRPNGRGATERQDAMRIIRSRDFNREIADSLENLRL